MFEKVDIIFDGAVLAFLMNSAISAISPWWVPDKTFCNNNLYKKVSVLDFDWEGFFVTRAYTGDGNSIKDYHTFDGLRHKGYFVNHRFEGLKYCGAYNSIGYTEGDAVYDCGEVE